MAALGKFLRTLSGGQIAFWCPACKEIHQILVYSDEPYHNWEFNGNLDSPTFTPSIKVTSHRWTKEGKAQYDAWVEAGCPKDGSVKGPPYPSMDTCCHSFVTDGKINYWGDCTHDMNGMQGVPLPEFKIPENFTLGGDL